MEKEVLAALLGGLGGLASGAFAAWATIKAKHIDRVLEELKLWVSAYETKLLEERLADYRKLWKLTESTSRRRIAMLTPQMAKALAEKLTNWYYREGGIVLSEDSRDKFFEARNSLETPQSGQGRQDWHSRVVNDFSALRTALCEDMNSRRGPRLRSSEEKDMELQTQIEAQAEE